MYQLLCLSTPYYLAMPKARYIPSEIQDNNSDPLPTIISDRASKTASKSPPQKLTEFEKIPIIAPFFLLFLKFLSYSIFNVIFSSPEGGG